MKVSDYIVDFFISKKITDVFGYPGGMVTHLMDSFSKRKNEIRAHVCYHEQAASFEACAFAQASNSVGAAYATSGPGATNLITGICNAYFDSIPVIFLTGQVNTFESAGEYHVRQRGFQETDIVGMVKNVTKYAVYIDKAERIAYELEKAYALAVSGRRGPVLLDIPMNIQRSEIEEDALEHYSEEKKQNRLNLSEIINLLENAKRPCMILGAAWKKIEAKKIEAFVEHMNMPVVTSMTAIDLLPHDYPLNYGFIGAYGTRQANFIVAKSDLILSIGSRMDVRQVGGKRMNFAPDAKIIRIDIDAGELEYKIREDEIGIQTDIETIIHLLQKEYFPEQNCCEKWKKVCDEIKKELSDIDDRNCNYFMKKVSSYVPSGVVITTDVGQNQVWAAQSFSIKEGQKMLFSGGHGAMGYSLPAAIGAYYATGKPVISLNGDGGFQMNMQELEFIRREQLPIKIFIFNNYALGMIRHFQEMYFDCNYVQTVSGQGYEAPDFRGIAEAYHMPYIAYQKPDEVTAEFMQTEGPVLVEIILREDTYVFPKLEFGKPNQDQEPLIDRTLFQKLMEM